MKIARSEAAAGNTVMVLFPNWIWVSAALRQPRPSGVYLRASTVESGLKSLLIDTLILVGRHDPAWNKKGELYARERTRASLKPQVIIAEK